LFIPIFLCLCRPSGYGTSAPRRCVVTTEGATSSSSSLTRVPVRGFPLLLSFKGRILEAMAIKKFYRHTVLICLALFLLIPACDFQLAPDVHKNEGDKWTLWSLTANGKEKSWIKKSSFSTSVKCAKVQRKAWERDYNYSMTIKGKRVGLGYVKIKTVIGSRYTKIKRLFKDGSISTTQFVCYTAGYDPRKRK